MPRRSGARVIKRKPLPSDRTRVINAKKVANAAIAAADRLAKDPTSSRSTRTRAGYKTKADALDRVVEILAGK